jgi:hypothetical protein
VLVHAEDLGDDEDDRKALARAGIARYAGIAKPFESIVTGPATRPSVPVATALAVHRLRPRGKPLRPSACEGSGRVRGRDSGSGRSMGVLARVERGDCI